MLETLELQGVKDTKWIKLAEEETKDGAYVHYLKYVLRIVLASMHI